MQYIRTVAFWLAVIAAAYVIMAVFITIDETRPGRDEPTSTTVRDVRYDVACGRFYINGKYYSSSSCACIMYVDDVYEMHYNLPPTLADSYHRSHTPLREACKYY